MTDPIYKKPKVERNNSDDNLNAIPNQGDSSPEPEIDWLDEEDAIDRLLRNDGFDLPDEAEQTGDKYAVIDNILPDIFDDFSDFDERSDSDEPEALQAWEVEETNGSAADSLEFIEPVQQPAVIDDPVAEAIGDLAGEDQHGNEIDEFGDDFVEPHDDIFAVEPVNLTKPTAPAETEAVSGQKYQDDDFLLADFDIPSDTEVFDMDSHSEIEEDEPGVTEAVAGKAIEEELKPESSHSESAAEIEPEQFPDNHDTDTNSAAALLNQFKSEQESFNRQQKKLIKECENKVKKAAVFTYAALGFSIAVLCATLGMGWIVYNAKTEVSKLTALVAVITEDMGSITGENAAKRVGSSSLSIEQLNEKVDELMEQVKVKSQSPTNTVMEEMANVIAKQEALTKSFEHLQTRIDVLEKGKLLEKSGPSTNLLNGVKKDSATKPETINNSTKKSSRSLAKTAPVKKRTEKLKKAQTAVNWSVNLIAFKQQWYAKSKADEFVQKGIPVEVIEVNVDDAIWYRLRVNGFKNKEEAASYAARVKKALNLSSVWVGNI
ncbi:MAG: SPOR domain-containing protein [Methylobacter sp.]